LKTMLLPAIITILHRAWNHHVSRALHHTILREVLSTMAILVHLDHLGQGIQLHAINQCV
jgi:hypothetical protein